jgi:hypothetical protein
MATEYVEKHFGFGKSSHFFQSRGILCLSALKRIAALFCLFTKMALFLF